MQTWEWVVIAVVLTGAVVFTLAWWKIADQWADSEHKRFKSKDGAPVERVMIKRADGGAGSPGGANGAGGGAGEGGSHG